MVSQDPLMSVIVLIVGPIVGLAVRKMGHMARKAARVQAATTANTIGIIRETSQGARIIKSFQLEDLLSKRMSSAVETMEITANKAATVRAGVNPLIETLGGLSVAGVVAYAGWQITLGIETPGHLMAFVTALLLAADPARRLSKCHLELKSFAVGVELMFEIFDTPVAESKKGKGPHLVIRSGNVRLDDVSFAYVNGKPILRDLSLAANGGETTALVGPSGGGKTTVFGLLQGFWKAGAGQISIDGQSIESVALASWRQRIAVVTQDVFLFEGSIRDNIMAARSSATDAELKAAARAAYAHEFIEQLPHGYETAVGELGDMISGGQRQRIAIARAFLKDAPILLLDEPTSALDSEAEKIVQEALGELMKGRTTIVIAHRFGTVLRAQKIHLIDQGHVVESGTHKELLRRNDFYARLYHLQSEHRAAVNVAE
jgi:ATP-binding cassette subfamily B protein